MTKVPGCELCEPLDPGTTVELASTSRLRVVRVTHAPAYPAFYRVIWLDHVVEWTDLVPRHRQFCMDAVAAIEIVLKETLQPRKINLASFGNVVPHLHWHVLARYDWDPHFPQPIWAPAVRPVDEVAAADVRARLAEVDERITQAVLSLPQA